MILVNAQVSMQNTNVCLHLQVIVMHLQCKIVCIWGEAVKTKCVDEDVLSRVFVPRLDTQQVNKLCKCVCVSDKKKYLTWT